MEVVVAIPMPLSLWRDGRTKRFRVTRAEAGFPGREKMSFVSR